MEAHRRDCHTIFCRAGDTPSRSPTALRLCERRWPTVVAQQDYNMENLTLLALVTESRENSKKFSTVFLNVVVVNSESDFEDRRHEFFPAHCQSPPVFLKCFTFAFQF